MDYRKINSHIILLAIVIIVGLLAAIIVRLSMLENGADTGTANLTFLLIFGASAVFYLIIMATLSRYIVPWLMKLLSFLTKKPIPQEIPEPAKTLEKEDKPIAEVPPAQVSVTVQAPALPAEDPTPTPAQQEIPAVDTKKTKPVHTATIELSPAVDIEKIKQSADQQYIERFKAKIDLFKRYTHTVIGPYVTAGELARLDEYVDRYAIEEKLSKEIQPVKPEKLTNHDLFHFGWNMAHYFDQKKQDVVPWLQKVFKQLGGLEPSYIKGKLYDGQSTRYAIANIDDIPEFMAELDS